MAQLERGSKLPSFTVQDVHGKEHRSQDYRGKKLLVSFYRYASCPFCNLRMHELIQKYPQYQTTGLEAIAFFESPVDSLQKLMENHKPPFPVVGDPKLHWYGEFGVRPSFWGLVKGFFDWKNFFKAWGLGYKPGKVEGNFAIMPADFLIDEEGRVYSAHYGKSMSDHLPLDQIENWLGSIGPAAAQFPKALPTFLKDLPYGVTKNI